MGKYADRLKHTAAKTKLSATIRLPQRRVIHKMNRIYKQKLRRYLLALVMLAVAGYISIFIKDTLDSKNPEASLPIITVTSGYTNIPNAPRAGYEWKYTTKTVKSPYVSSIEVPLTVYEALPEMPILISFSTPYQQITLYESRQESPEKFVEKRYGMTTASEDGVYIYKVVAKFDKGTIVHYFALDVKRPNTIA